MENYQEEISEKIKNFCKEVPALNQRADYLDKITPQKTQNMNGSIMTHHKTPILGDKSSTDSIKPYVLYMSIINSNQYYINKECLERHLDLEEA